MRYHRNVLCDHTWSWSSRQLLESATFVSGREEDFDVQTFVAPSAVGLFDIAFFLHDPLPDVSIYDGFATERLNFPFS